MRTFKVRLNDGSEIELAVPKDWNADHFTALVERTDKPGIQPGEKRVIVGNLTAGIANAFAFAVQNPESVDCMITRVIVNVVTAGGTANAVLDVDVVASATDTGDDIIDGALLNVTSTIYDSIIDKGTNGDIKAIRWDAKGGTNDYITGKILVANAASLVGKYYIEYMGV